MGGFELLFKLAYKPVLLLRFQKINNGRGTRKQLYYYMKVKTSYRSVMALLSATRRAGYEARLLSRKEALALKFKAQFKEPVFWIEIIPRERYKSDTAFLNKYSQSLRSVLEDAHCGFLFKHL